MDAVAKFGEPVRVSPLIKFCRWSLLLLGITYGFNRNSFLQRRADRLKNLRDQRKSDRLKYEKEMKERKEYDDAKYLESATGAKFLPD